MTPDQIQDFLNKLANAITDTAHYAFGILVKQIVVESIVGIAFSLILLGAIYIAVTRINGLVNSLWLEQVDAYKQKATDKYGYRVDAPDSFYFYMPKMATYGFGFMIAFGVLYNLSTNVIHLLNPEYAAVERLILLIK